MDNFRRIKRWEARLVQHGLFLKTEGKEGKKLSQYIFNKYVNYAARRSVSEFWTQFNEINDRYQK